MTYQQTKRYDFLKAIEGEELLAYADTAGIATIGVGLNLTVHGRLVLEALGFDMDGSVLSDAAATAEAQYIERFS